MKLRLIAVALAALGLSGCALGTTNIKTGLAPDIAKVGLLSEAPKRSVVVYDVVDNRPGDRKDRIGDKRNGYGQAMGKIGSETPPPEVVRKVIADTFSKNNHTVIAPGAAGDFKVETELKDFWFDYKTGLVTVEFFGNVEVHLTVTDAQAGNVVYSGDFKGYYSEKTGGGLSGTWTRIMDAALADLSRDISLSPDLKAALEKAGPPTS